MFKLGPILLLFASAAFVAGSTQTHAAGSGRCLPQDKRRAAITSHQAIPLGRAIHAARGRHAGEVIRARLCERPGGLVYMLTLLARDGKVSHVTVDAGSGAVLGR
jgi:uncharacterized membrane protein YkoI